MRYLLLLPLLAFVGCADTYDPGYRTQSYRSSAYPNYASRYPSGYSNDYRYSQAGPGGYENCGTAYAPRPCRPTRWDRGY
jgi:hypothetical protein